MENHTTQVMQIIVSVITVIGSIFGAYMGVRIAIAELKGRHDTLSTKVEGIDNRLCRVEDKVL